MPFDWTALEQEAQDKITRSESLEALEQLKIKYLGRQGLLAGITGSIPGLPPEERPETGKKANLLKGVILRLLDEREKQLRARDRACAANFDFSLPGKTVQTGTTHPITQTIEEITSIFTRMGFVTVEGPEVENEFNNFTGLNIPLDHPSRDAFDTFYLKSPQFTVHSPQNKTKDHRLSTIDYRLLLRSHTSPVQIRVMQKHKPPLAVIVPGKVYRPDAVDASHSFMFHQVEGFLVDEAVSFSDLKGVLTLFARKLFGQDIKMRFRPHFFPFTEPSAEVDISCIICGAHKSTRAQEHQQKRCSVCGGKGWLEILGCGLIHPNVFKNVGYPKGKYSGFAFGMGVDRIAMLKHGINDIRLFYENDLRFLRQF